MPWSANYNEEGPWCWILFCVDVVTQVVPKQKCDATKNGQAFVHRWVNISDKINRQHFASICGHHFPRWCFGQSSRFLVKTNSKCGLFLAGVCWGMRLIACWSLACVRLNADVQVYKLCVLGMQITDRSWNWQSSTLVANIDVEINPVAD